MQRGKIMEEKMMCSVCKKKESKWITRMNYSFCSKICIANHTIEHFRVKRIVRDEL